MENGDMPVDDAQPKQNTVTETNATDNANTPPASADATLTTTASNDEAPAMQANGKPLCGVCNAAESKYKCPRCYLRYCSIACNKIHRDNHPPDPIPPPQPKSEPTPAPAVAHDASSDPSNPFRALHSSPHLQHLFNKYPYLPQQLSQIYAATQPPPEAAANPGIPASLLKDLPPPKETWNHDMGIQSGKDALRKARRAGGDQGKAIREYTELILHLMNQGKTDAQSDADRLLQSKVSQEDSKLIERLMENEKR